MALLFDALFDTVDEGQEAQQKNLLKNKIQTSRANKGLDTTKLNWFNLAQLAFADTSASGFEEAAQRTHTIGFRFHSLWD